MTPEFWNQTTPAGRQAILQRLNIGNVTFKFLNWKYLPIELKVRLEGKTSTDPRN